MSFINSDSGAVTVDWVVLTAGLVGLGLAVMSTVSTGVEDLSNDTSDQLREDHIIRSSFNFAPTILNQVPMQNASSSGGQCSLDPQGAVVCEPDISIVTSYYNMTNGDEWSYVEKSIDGVGQEPYWLDTDGNTVTLSNGPSIPDDVELAPLG